MNKLYMKERQFLKLFFFSIAVCTCPENHTQADEVRVTLRPVATGIELSVPTTMTDAVGELAFPQYAIEFSTNLVNWQPIGGKLRGLSGRSGSMLSLLLEKQPGPVFYRASRDPGS